MRIEKAVRRAVPMIMSISGVSGSGKTYSALLVAAGLAKPNGKIGFLDTENRRGVMYVDSPGIVAALPHGYNYGEISAPFHPKTYIDAIHEFEQYGCEVLIIDSGSHAWEGEGGCTDIAEADKGRWNKAKLWNKRLVSCLLSSPLHIIVCLRAREKSKIIKIGNKEETISLGIQPICEKGFPYEMLLSLMVDEQTKVATAIKCPEPLKHLFVTPRMLIKKDGEAIRQWNETGEAIDPMERLHKRAKSAAEEGIESYEAFFKSLPAAQKKVLADTTHAENKEYARFRSEEIAAQREGEEQAAKEEAAAVV